jgi:hypothetical protein
VLVPGGFQGNQRCPRCSIQGSKLTPGHGIHTSIVLGGDRVDVGILAPLGTFASRFDANTVVLERLYGVRVFNPSGLLESKYRSVLGRSTEAKKQSDAYDTLFLLDYLYQHGIQTSPAEVPVAESFKNWFDVNFDQESTEIWERIGL